LKENIKKEMQRDGPFLGIACRAVHGLCLTVFAVVFSAIQVSGEESYNLKLGPTNLRVDAGLRTGYNDNINLSEVNPVGSFFVEPYSNFGLVWDVTELNQLRFNMGIGYRKYFDSEQDDSSNIRIAPDSEIEFQFFVGKQWRIVLFDRFRLDQDPLDFPTISNTFRFSRFQNQAGVQAYWEINPYWTYNVGYTNEFVHATDSNFRFLNRMGHIGNSSITWQANEDWKVGLGGSLAWYDYEQNFNNNGGNLSIGPFFEGRLSENLRVAGGISYFQSTFDSGGRSGDTSSLGTVNGFGRITHDVNRFLSHSIEGGRKSELGLISNSFSTNYVRHQSSWLIIQDVGIGTTAFLEFGEESESFLAEDFTRYGVGINLTYQLTRSISTSLGYNYIVKDSNQPLRSYSQNQVTLDFRYRF
jgi:hypothetical protein